MLPLYQVDAFTNRPFAGNPAAVCPLASGEMPDERWMQHVAAENNLSETAFLFPAETAGTYRIRYFTPTVEVPLCGHATLASAHALWSEGIVPAGEDILFHAEKCDLTTRQENIDGAPWIVMAFPADPVAPAPPHAALLEALGLDQSRSESFLSSFGSRLVVLKNESAVRAVAPDFGKLHAVAGVDHVCVTAPADPASGLDFVSRFFAPRYGIDEDPVTGSAHCMLTPYWSERLGKEELMAAQVSQRGGLLRLRHSPGTDHVDICGQAVTVLRGELLAPDPSAD